MGIFEKSPFEHELIESGFFIGEEAVLSEWKSRVEEIIDQTSLDLGDWNIITPVLGGRLGEHSEHLQPLLDEMSEVFKVDPTANW